MRKSDTMRMGRFIRLHQLNVYCSKLHCAAGVWSPGSGDNEEVDDDNKDDIYVDFYVDAVVTNQAARKYPELVSGGKK